jgi:hypothetical protein
MGHSGRERHRDREPGRREATDDPHPASNRVFRITDEQRLQIARCLRLIDETRRTLERRMNADNREIIRELRASADRIFELLNDLEETDGPQTPQTG